MAQCRNSTAALGASGWGTRLLRCEIYAVEGEVATPAGRTGENAEEAAAHIGPGTESPRPPSPPRQAQHLLPICPT